MVDPQLTTLLDLSRRQHVRAERGQHGEGSNKTGRDGADVEIPVPPGTVVRDADTGDLLGEVLEPGDRLLVARGGRGGRGNARFASSTRQAPRRWEPGEEGEEHRITLELKLIADVGLVGKPNAGKSTLLAAISEAHPKVADYPFTTLAPALGVVRLPDYRSFVVADIPGIIEGAHEGKGLGLRFLRHIERTRALALLIPVDAADHQREYDQLREELGSYSQELLDTPHCVVFTKSDLLGPSDPPPSVKAETAWQTFTVSAVAQQGIPGLLEGLYAQTHQDPAAGVDRLGEEEWWVPEE